MRLEKARFEKLTLPHSSLRFGSLYFLRFLIYTVKFHLIGNMRNLQDNWPSVLLAVAGGVLLSIGNLATQYAFAFVGLSVTEVITASITVVIGMHPLSLIF